jgi:hypothetical protein
MRDLILLLEEPENAVKSHRRQVSGALQVAAVLAAVPAYQSHNSR